MEYFETKKSGEEKYNGVIVEVTLDDVELHTGEMTKREVVHHSGGVAVLPLDEEGNVYCVRQFRYPFGTMLLEIPAGKLESGEDPLEGAKRELSEETGFTAEKWTGLGESYASPGYCTEVLHLYLARGLKPHPAHPDAGEYLNVEKYSLSRLTELCMNGEIRDGKTLVAVLKTARLLEAHNG